MAARPRTVWRCGACGYASSRWVGRCPDCSEIGLFEEDASGSSADNVVAPVLAVPISEVSIGSEDRIPTGLGEFDRVLGGGLVAGSVVLIGGRPGIGKSTLLLQAADSLARAGRSVIYVCGEESPAQVRIRAERLDTLGGGVSLLAEVDVAVIGASAIHSRPQVLVVDSIQTVYSDELDGAPGSVGQVRTCTAKLARLAKEHGITVIVVGHVTKDGSIAGPRVLEHMVDTVLYFEGDDEHAFRVVRAVKNRFGSVSEIALFQMGASGLVAVGSPSDMLLTRRDEGVAGSVVLATMEGSRPLLVELQALVTPSYMDMPRRLANGLDRNRMLQTIAVLERRAGVSFSQHDVYVAVAGGVRVTEPGVDLALALALASARSDRAVRPGTVAFGEVGLTGEIRRVPGVEPRLGEAASMGMRVAITPDGAGASLDGLEVRGCSTLSEALEAVS